MQVKGKTEQAIGYKFYVQICRAAATYPLISVKPVDDCNQNEDFGLPGFSKSL